MISALASLCISNQIALVLPVVLTAAKPSICLSQFNFNGAGVFENTKVEGKGSKDFPPLKSCCTCVGDVNLGQPLTSWT